MAKESDRDPVIDMRPIVEKLGLHQFIEQVGAQRIIDSLDPQQVVETLGAKRVVDALGVDTIAAHLSREQRRELQRLLAEQSCEGNGG